MGSDLQVWASVGHGQVSGEFSFHYIRIVKSSRKIKWYNSRRFYIIVNMMDSSVENKLIFLFVKGCLRSDPLRDQYANWTEKHFIAEGWMRRRSISFGSLTIFTTLQPRFDWRGNKTFVSQPPRLYAVDLTCLGETRFIRWKDWRRGGKCSAIMCFLVIAPPFVMEMEFCNDSHENTLTFHHVLQIQFDKMLRKASSENKPEKKNPLWERCWPCSPKRTWQREQHRLIQCFAWVMNPGERLFNNSHKITMEAKWTYSPVEPLIYLFTRHADPSLKKSSVVGQ